MESPYNEVDNTPTKHLMPLIKTSSATNGLHVELSAKEVLQTCTNITGHCQGYWLLLRNLMVRPNPEDTIYLHHQT